MASFSQRIGVIPIKTIIQLESIDDDLRNSLWNTYISCYSMGDVTIFFSRENIVKIWIGYLRRTIDSMDKEFEAAKIIRNYFLTCKWYEVYDFIEFVANNCETASGGKNDFMKLCNKSLEEEISAYRFIDGKITPITDEIELDEIDEALKSPYISVQEHLKCAINFLADRQNPNYRNSIKESISSVEALCKIIVKDDKATLGQALDKIEKQKELKIHPSLKLAFDKLYGYTSDDNGIRHALSDVDNVAFDDAKFMLVSCSAFVNYVISKIDK